MAKTEELIEKKFGRENPFTVPEGYFAQLQKNVMDSLPEQSPKVVKMTPRHHYLLPVMTAVASVCVAICGISIWFNKVAATAENPNYTLSETTGFHQANSNADADDYIVMDNEDIYKYISEQ